MYKKQKDSILKNAGGNEKNRTSNENPFIGALTLICGKMEGQGNPNARANWHVSGIKRSSAGSVYLCLCMHVRYS